LSTPLLVLELTTKRQEKTFQTIIALVIVKPKLMVFFGSPINAIEFINVLAAEQGKLKKTNNQLIDEEGRMNKIKHHPTCQINQIKAVVSQIELRPLYFKLNRQGSHSLRLAN